MYIHIHQDQECSACGAVNKTEHVTREFYSGQTTTYIRCTMCGHEKEIYTTSWASTGGSISYQAEQIDNKVKF